MPSKTLAACKDELRLRNCGMGHMPAEEFVKSQWQSRTKSTMFLLYRLALGIFFTAVVINSIVVSAQTDASHYFIYLTHLGILMCMATSVLGAGLVARWYFHPEYSDKICNCEDMPRAFKVYWIMHNCTLILSICITIIYWGVLHNDTMPVDANNLLIHAFNCVFMVIDLVIVAYPVRIWHMIQPIALGVTYCLFTVVYYLCGGVNKNGDPFIYKVLDWRTPEKAMITVVGTTLLGVTVHVLMFFLYKARTWIYVRYFSTETMLPTNSTVSLQHSGKSRDGISMVYGNDNRAFTVSEKY